MWVYLLRREVVYPPRARALTTDLRSGTFNPGKGCCPETGKRQAALKATDRATGVDKVHLDNTVNCDRQHGG